MLEEDQELLRIKYKECKDAKEKIRYGALYAVSRGKSIEVVSDILDVDESTIYDWINRWLDGKDVTDRPRSGRPPEITKEDEEEIKKLLDENDPKKHGINASSYTTKELQQYFLEVHKRYINGEILRRCLHNIGAKYVKAQLRYKEADPKLQAMFSRNFCELVTNYNFSKIVFVDEMSVSTSAHKGYGWTLNDRLIVDAPQSNVQRANYFGAVEITEGNVVETVRKSAKADSFLILLNKIKSKYPDEKTLVIMDNGRVHKSRRSKEFFSNHENMKLLFLPPYSPDMNPEEYLHNHFRNKLLNNCNFKSVKQIGIVIDKFVKRMDRELVKSIATLIPIETMLSFQV